MTRKADYLPRVHKIFAPADNVQNIYSNTWKLLNK